ncbi:prolactin-releasing peptide receptor-like [Arctopsyche grandis]|uniref:prolactin-releasing peptide receptor-like n=1 Tax=Arctopsyche grandis TaxID=121162 RepID=UPI00406D6EEA
MTLDDKMASNASSWILSTTLEPANATYMEVSAVNATKYDIIENKLVQAMFCVLYTLIFLLGVFGNVLVCYVVFRNRTMQTVTNLFITNLALSDILLCLFAVPFTPLYTFMGRWIFGKLLCHVMPYAQGCSVYISTLTLTSIAIDRFFVIIYPFHPRMKLTTCIGIIFLIWTFSLGITFPYGWYMELQEKGNITYCEEAWPSEKSRKIYGGLTTTMQFILPFIIIAFCYTCVSFKLNDRAKAKPGSKNMRKEEADRDRKRRTNRMLIAMVAIFGVSWMPLNLINVFYDFYMATSDWAYYFLSFFMAHSVAMSSTCYNPFLYAWLNENFRKEFKQVLPCFDPTLSGRGGTQSGRLGGYRSERTCNGNNETIQESLLPSSVQRVPSIKCVDDRKESRVEVEQVVIGASYSPHGESVRLHLISEEAPQARFNSDKPSLLAA